MASSKGELLLKETGLSWLALFAASGTLGSLIPPSILAIIYAVVAEQSVGELFIGSVIPGLMLSSMYIAYISIRCFITTPDVRR